jgi:spheroidene monooxygenase
LGQIVSLSLHRFESLASKLWAFSMMGLARRPLSQVPGIGFWKLCGSGGGLGFQPRPNWAVYAILATWPGEAEAREAIERARVFARFRANAAECWTILLRPISARGAWSGRAPFEPGPSRGDGPIAALTRGSVRTGALWPFWSRVPAIENRIGANSEVLFKIGIGEVPWLHQVTFSVWPDSAAMARFARSGPHAEAIAAVRAQGWFAEDLYARFEVAGEMGTWNGRTSLGHPDGTPSPAMAALGRGSST